MDSDKTRAGLMVTSGRDTAHRITVSKETFKHQIRVRVSRKDRDLTTRLTLILTRDRPSLLIIRVMTRHNPNRITVAKVSIKIGQILQVIIVTKILEILLQRSQITGNYYCAVTNVARFGYL